MLIVFTVIGILLLLVGCMWLFVQLSPERVTAMALHAARKQSGLTCHELTLTDGMRFAYLEGGTGEPLVMLHGFGGNKDNFTKVARYLVEYYRLIIPDIIGFAESSHPSDVDYTPLAQAERIRAFLQTLDIHKLHLAGNSMGAQIALAYAAQYPAEVASLCLIGPAGLWSAPASDVLKEYYENGRNRLIASNLKEYKQVMALGIYKPPRIPKAMLKVLARERIENVELEKQIFNQLMQVSLEEKSKGLTTPTLVMFGEHDRVISLTTADLLCELLPNAETATIKQAGHVTMFDRPTQCARQYLDFRNTLEK